MSKHWRSSPKDRLQSHQVHLTVLRYYACMQCTQNNTYTKMNLTTVKRAQWDKTQSGELLGLFICVCIALCTTVAHNIALNRPDSFHSYHGDNHHCSDDVYLREGGLWWFIGKSLPENLLKYRQNLLQAESPYQQTVSNGIRKIKPICILCMSDDRGSVLERDVERGLTGKRLIQVHLENETEPGRCRYQQQRWTER